MTLAGFCQKQGFTSLTAVVAPFDTEGWHFVALPDAAEAFSVIEAWFEEHGLRFVQNQSVADHPGMTVVTAIRTERLIDREYYTIWMFRDAVHAVHFKLRFG